MSRHEWRIRDHQLKIWCLAVSITLITGWPVPVKAGEIAIKTILTQPEQFNQQEVTVRGQATDIKASVSRRGKPYTTFSITDSSGATLRVTSWGHTEIRSNDQVEATGHFQKLKRVGRHSTHNELQASTVRKIESSFQHRAVDWLFQVTMPLRPVLDHPILPIAVLVVVVWIVLKWITRARRRARVKRLKDEAINFFNEIERTGTLTRPATQLMLQKGEVAIFDEKSILSESRAYRLYGGAGTRVGGVYVGGGVSESQQRLKRIDEGILTLTNERLIFDGSLENRTLALSDILSVNPWLDAIEVSIRRRAKSQVFSASNPFIWTMLIEQVAAGKLAIKQDQL